MLRPEIRRDNAQGIAATGAVRTPTRSWRITHGIKSNHHAITRFTPEGDARTVYRELFAIYSTAYKQNTPAAENILLKGISSVKNPTDLEVLLARYYVKAGRTADARAMFNKAIASANAAGNTQIAQSIADEVSKL